jgi:hypothetical protein
MIMTVASPLFSLAGGGGRDTFPDLGSVGYVVSTLARLPHGAFLGPIKSSIHEGLACYVEIVCCHIVLYDYQHMCARPKPKEPLQG